MDVKLENDFAKIPYKKYDDDAGYDLYSCENKIIPPKQRVLVDTGISISIPNNTYAKIAPRSGLSVKGIDIGAGVVDKSYTGIIKVLMINNTDEPYIVSIHDRIAQLIIHLILNVDIRVVDNLKETERGDCGFGSTGV